MAQRDVVDQQHQTDGLRRLRGRGAQRHLPGDDGHLGLEVDAPALLGHDGVAGSDEAVGAALIHQRVGVEGGGHFGFACLAYQLDMVDVGRTVGPLEGARQGRVAGGGVEGLGVPCCSGLQGQRRIAQQRGAARPVVERGLQGRGDVGHRLAQGQGVVDHDQSAVRGRGLQRGQPHWNISL